MRLHLIGTSEELARACLVLRDLVGISGVTEIRDAGLGVFTMGLVLDLP
jgi:hypothetical protein